MEKKLKIINTVICLILIIVILIVMVSEANSISEEISFLLMLVLIFSVVAIEMYFDVTQKKYSTLIAIIITEIIQMIIIVNMIILVILHFNTTIRLTFLNNSLNVYITSILISIFYTSFNVIRTSIKNDKFKIK